MSTLNLSKEKEKKNNLTKVNQTYWDQVACDLEFFTFTVKWRKRRKGRKKWKRRRKKIKQKVKYESETVLDNS